MDLSAKIREKENWESKYKNNEIRQKWKKEFRSRGGNTEDMFEYVMKELEYYESQQHGAIKVRF